MSTFTYILDRESGELPVTVEYEPGDPDWICATAYDADGCEVRLTADKQKAIDARAIEDNACVLADAREGS